MLTEDLTSDLQTSAQAWGSPPTQGHDAERGVRPVRCWGGGGRSGSRDLTRDERTAPCGLSATSSRCGPAVRGDLLSSPHLDPSAPPRGTVLYAGRAVWSPSGAHGRALCKPRAVPPARCAHDQPPTDASTHRPSLPPASVPRLSARTAPAERSPCWPWDGSPGRRGPEAAPASTRGWGWTSVGGTGAQLYTLKFNFNARHTAR